MLEFTILLIVLGITILCMYGLYKLLERKVDRLESNSRADCKQVIRLTKDVAKLEVAVKVLERNKKEVSKE